MSLSLRARFFLACALAPAVALALVTLLAAREQREWLLRRGAESLARTADLVVRELPADPAGARGDWPGAAEALGGALALRVTLIGADGRVLGDTDVPRAELAGHTGSDVRRSRTVGVEFLYLARPAALGEVRVVRIAQPLTALGALR